MPAPHFTATAVADEPALGTVLFSLEKVRVEFGKLMAVRDVSFELRAGSLLGLIGPNGAGKTTLLRAIASLQPISGGAISVLGERIYPGDEEGASPVAGLAGQWVVAVGFGAWAVMRKERIGVVEENVSV